MPELNITTVTYRRLKSDSYGYGHQMIEASADVGDGEDAKATLDQLRDWVLGEVELCSQRRALAGEVEALQRRVCELKAQTRSYGVKVRDLATARTILEDEPEERPNVEAMDDLPFEADDEDWDGDDAYA